MHMKIRSALLPLLVAMLACPALASERAADGSFWERKHEGWFFYNEQLQPDEPPPPEPAPAEPPTTTTTVTPPPSQESRPDRQLAPQPFSAEWFRKNLQRYKDEAWNNPTVENVKAFMYLQRMAMDRSSQFADAAQLATLGNPYLDESVRRPTATYASQEMDKIAGRARNALLTKLSESVGVFFFYSSTCELCASQVPVLKMIEGKFATTPISLDGKDLPGNPFPDMKPDQGHAEMLGIEGLPAIVLVSPEGEFAPIAQGALALTDIHQRMVLAARQRGWISEEEFHRTRPVNSEYNLSEIVSLEAFSNHQKDDSDSGFIPPNELLRTIESSIKGY